jgi:hypothetical protein
LILIHLGSYELSSWLLFAAFILVAIVLQPSFLSFYIALLVFDFLLTLFDLGALITIERPFFGLIFVLVGAFAENYTAFESVVSVIAVIVLVDFTFLVRRLHDTNAITYSVLLKRLRAYVPSAGSAILVSYLFIFLYSQLSFALPYAIGIFGVATVGAFLLFVKIIRTFKDSAGNPLRENSRR